MALHSQRKEYNKAITILQEWVANHPNDQMARRRLDDLKKMAADADSLAKPIINSAKDDTVASN